MHVFTGTTAAARIGHPALVSRSALMRTVLELASRAAQRDSKVLITGETGSGKDLLARFIHGVSPRAARPFVAVNCAGLAETLLESELFGHVKGSFTGAYRDKPGKLQLAHGGTVFLDEIGEMTARMQALLLRFLENGEVQPVGGDASNLRVDTRVVAATHRDLPKRAAHGLFREDLLFRIRVVHLHVPPLRERAEDIRPLVQHFIDRADPTLALTAGAWAALEAYAWPGNVRELQNVVEQLSAAPHARFVEAADLPIGRHATSVRGAVALPAIDRRWGIADDLFEEMVGGTSSFWSAVYEPFMSHELARADVRKVVTRGLAATLGNYRQVARLYGMPPQDYKRFIKFLARHGCTIDFRPYRRARVAASPVRPLVN